MTPPGPGGVPGGASWLMKSSVTASISRGLVVGREDLLQHPPGGRLDVGGVDSCGHLGPSQSEHRCVVTVLSIHASIILVNV